MKSIENQKKIKRLLNSHEKKDGSKILYKDILFWINKSEKLRPIAKSTFTSWMMSIDSLHSRPCPDYAVILVEKVINQYAIPKKNKKT